MEAENPRGVSVRAIVLLVAVALFVLVVDQLAKWWVVTTLPYRVPREVVGNLLIFEYDRNPGAAFSIGTGSTWIFSIVGIAVLVFVIWYARRIRSVVWAIVFGLVLGGLLGNLSDLLFRPPSFGVGEVVDFLRIPLLPAIFNLADSAIVGAMILFLVLTVLGIGLDGKRAGNRADAASVDADASEPAPDTAPAADERPGDDEASGDASSSDDERRRDAPDGRERAESRAVRAGETGHPAPGHV